MKPLIIVLSLVWITSCSDVVPDKEDIVHKRTTDKSDSFRDFLKDGTSGPEMVWIKAGSFQMGNMKGNSDEKPLHNVSIKRFAMGKYELTFAEYDQFAKATDRNMPDDKGWGRDNHPVINVDWNDVTDYVIWLSHKTGKTYRLPTEAEWEYAARADTSTQYWWGDNMGSHQENCIKSFCDDNFRYTAPVGSFEPNPWGLYDTVGNVQEWVQDWYDMSYYSTTTNNNPTGPSTGILRVSRGGHWNQTPNHVTVRYFNRPGNRNSQRGVRLVRTAD